jgi:hypothetical protein
MVKKRSYIKEKDKPKVKQELENSSPIIVRFYKATCPACQMSKGAWDSYADSMMSSPYRMVEVEEDAIPEDVMKGISAFPTYAKHDQKGSSHTVGAILEPAEIGNRLSIGKSQ